MRATMLLADWAEAINGKLYIQGGGWSRTAVPQGMPFTFSVAVKLDVEWTEANERQHLRISLLTQDGEPYLPDGAHPVVLETDIEVGRPPGLAHGTPLDVPFAFQFKDLPLSPGRYEVQIACNDVVLTSAAFDALALPPVLAP